MQKSNDDVTTTRRSVLPGLGLLAVSISHMSQTEIHGYTHLNMASGMQLDMAFGFPLTAKASTAPTKLPDDEFEITVSSAYEGRHYTRPQIPVYRSKFL